MLAGYPVHVLYPTVAVPMNQRMIAQFLKRGLSPLLWVPPLSPVHLSLCSLVE